LSGRTGLLAVTTPLAAAVALTLAAVIAGQASSPLWRSPPRSRHSICSRRRGVSGFAAAPDCRWRPH
jgi:hypothetical protein